jgi:tetratricopeptide (TPR) repeat protein
VTGARATAALVGLVALASAAGGRAQSDYAEAWEVASALEREERYEEAVAALAPLLERYPQDYALSLQLGWLAFRAEEYGAAERHYRQAVALSGGSREAQLGLGWTLLRRGEAGAARGVFRALLEAHGEEASALEGLALAERAVGGGWDTWVGGFYHAYGGHPDVTRGWTVALGVRGLALDHLLVAAAYRYSRYVYETREAQGRGGGGNRAPERRVESDAHEVYVAAGAVFAAAGAALHYARLSLAEGDAVDVLGLTARYSPWGDLLLEASVALFPDAEVVRLAPGWSLPVLAWLRVEPAASMQLEGGAGRWMGSLTLTVHGGPGAVRLGGKWGEEERLIALRAPAAYVLRGVTRFGGWLGGELALGDWRPFASWELAGVEVSGEGLVRTEVVHWVGVGLSRHW